MAKYCISWRFVRHVDLDWKFTERIRSRTMTTSPAILVALGLGGFFTVIMIGLAVAIKKNII